LRRGDLVTVAISGDFGKPRPALVIQSDAFANHATITVLLLSSAMIDAPLLRFTISPDTNNGLSLPSQIMIDKTMTVVRAKIRQCLAE
jgi:mRNA interferase MazF